MQWRIIPSAPVAVVGATAVDFLQRLSTNDVRGLAVGQSKESLLLSEKGQLQDWLQLLRLDTQRLWVLGKRFAEPFLNNWLQRYAAFEDLVVEPALAAGAGNLWLGGDSQAACLQLLMLPHWPQADGWVATANHALFWAAETHLNQPVALRGLIPSDQLAALTLHLEQQVGPALTHAQWERERMAAGLPQYPNEWPGSHNPLELNLGKRAVAWNKGCYVGQEVISRLDSYQKVTRRLMGLRHDHAFTSAYGESTSLWVTAADDTSRLWGKITSYQMDEQGFVALAVLKTSEAAQAIGQQVGVVTQLNTAPIGLATLVDSKF